MSYHTYQFEGMTLSVPIYFDPVAQKWIEDYHEYIERQVCTPEGHPILFSGEDACLLAEEAAPGGCPDCGSCRHYLRAAEHSWIGCCQRYCNPRQTP